MYLTGDAKLWWRTQMKDAASAGRPSIETWKELRKELRDQFLPYNKAWVARDALKKLKHTISMREYVKQFWSLMLDIKDMSKVNSCTISCPAYKCGQHLSYGGRESKVWLLPWLLQIGWWTFAKRKVKVRKSLSLRIRTRKGRARKLRSCPKASRTLAASYVANHIGQENAQRKSK
jgi:hypothetical protein